MYYNGIGLETPDFLEALKKFREAAELGNVSAQCNLAMMYKNGVGTNRYALLQIFTDIGQRYENGFEILPSSGEPRWRRLGYTLWASD